MVRSEYSIIYLHGFASGPSSTKDKYFAERLDELGLDVHVPDLNAGDFSNLTLTSQLNVLDETISQVPAYSNLVLIGSSMGGLLATIRAQSLERLAALILLAPGFGLPRRWSALLGHEGLKQWESSGTVEVYHHALEQNVRLRYGFVADANRYQTEGLLVDVPCLVFHGQDDDTVPVQESLRFAQDNCEFVELHVLDDDHQLITSLDTIWTISADFFVRHGMIGGALDWEDSQHISERH